MLRKSNKTSTSVLFMPEAVVNTIDEFLYNPEEGVIFYITEDTKKIKTKKNPWPDENKYVDF